MKNYYRENVGLCIVNENNLIFAGNRIKVAGIKDGNFYKKSWQMPQGGVDSILDQEILTEGMFRELKEETGIDRDKVKIIKKTNPIK